MPLEFKDYYATLGVSREASADDIKKAFRTLARKYHPDLNRGRAGTEEKFKEVNEANEVLSDPIKRKKYDELGANWQQEAQPSPRGQRGPGSGGPGVHSQEFHFGGTGFSDFFEQFFSGGTRYGVPGDGMDFGGGGRPRAGGPRRGSDVEGDLLVTLEEAMRGTLRSISLQMVDPRTGEATTHTFQVRIPPGATEGRRIRVPGRGEPGQGGGPAGDIFLRVRHAAHPDFHAKGADLYRELDVAPWEAALGAEIVVPTLDGSIKLRLPAGTQAGQQVRARGRGLPKGKSGERGDFYVVVAVQLPAQLTAEERTQWEKLRTLSRFNPRDSSPS